MRAAIAQDWLSDLAEFHDSVVAEACQEWRRANSKRPTIADIRLSCMEGSRPMGPREPPPSYPEYTPEQLEERVDRAREAQSAKDRDAAESRDQWARSHGVANFKEAMDIGLIAVSKRPVVA